MSSSGSHQVFGVRHHGPGCARSLLAALERFAPDALLIEGPPDAADVLPLATSPVMKPPVALLVYPPEKPGRAVFYPFAEFSPEWQAIQFGLGRGIPVRLMDLPQAHRMAEVEAETEADERGEKAAPSEDRARLDPIAALAEAAGYSDSELWWEHQVERRRDPTGLFEGLLEAMRALRESRPAPPDLEEQRREAFMRQTLRAAQKEGLHRIAVVCGAWHAPALAELGPARPDAELLKGLPRTKVAATWIPWTPARLTFRSGYGAGVHAPGWYQHLWTQPEQPTLRWVVRAAQALRGEDLPASTANVVEAVRLAEALASLRGLGSPGLAELNESIQAVLCDGAAAPLALVRERLEVGAELGQVPPEAPAVPLRRELEAEEKRLRLRRTDELKALDLDLRETTGRERSRLLHRLRLIGVEWGAPRAVAGKAGTFHERWDVRWQPELEVSLVEASRWGNTIAEASTARAVQLAAGLEDVGPLAELLDRVVVSELEGAIDALLARLQERAAVSADVAQLAAALPRLAHLLRYGSARGARPEPIRAIFDGLFERVRVGLPNACLALDEEAAARMGAAIEKVQEALALLELSEARAAWLDTLGGLAARDTTAPLVRGLAARVLLEQGRLDTEGLLRLASRALSHAVPPAEAAAWVEGLLRGSAVLLLHARELWAVLDTWLAGLGARDFEAMLPLLRRSFAAFQAPERRAMGELVRDLRGAGPRPRGAALSSGLDEERAARVTPVLAHVLGVKP